MKNNEVSFNGKHPKLSFFLGLVLIVAIGGFSIWLIKLLCNIIINGIIKLTEVASKLDAVVIVALITGLVSITGVIISSIVAKIVDYRKSRQEYLTQKREKIISDYKIYGILDRDNAIKKIQELRIKDRDIAAATAVNLSVSSTPFSQSTNDQIINELTMQMDILTAKLIKK